MLSVSSSLSFDPFLSRFCYFTIFSAGNVAEYNQCVWGQYQVLKVLTKIGNDARLFTARSALVAEEAPLNFEPLVPMVCVNKTQVDPQL